MIKLLENGTLTVLRTYTSIEEARLNVIWKSSEKYLVEYDNKIYSINRFLELTNNNNN